MSRIRRIRLLHTNDLHASLDAWPYVAATLRRLNEPKTTTLYLDAGDCLDLSDQVCYLTRGQVCVDLLADAGCAALACGNNELWRMPVPEVSARAVASPFPWISANIRDGQGQPLRGLCDWTMIELDGVKFGIFSLSDNYPAFAEAFGVQQSAFEPTARRCVAELRAAGADIILFLSHIGLDRDRTLGAAGVGIDLIIGGHSHTEVPEPERVNGVVIAQAGSYGTQVGLLDLEFDLEERRIVSIQGRLVPPDATPDENAQRILAAHRQAAQTLLDEVVAVLPEPLTHTTTGESRLAPLAAEAVWRRVGGEFGLMIGAQINQGLPAGPVTRRQVMEAAQSLWTPSLLEMEGSTLLELLRQSEDPAIISAEVGVGAQRPWGRIVGRLFTAGITDLRINGEPIDPDRTYRAAGISMMGVPQSGYPAFAKVRVLKRYLPEQVQEVLMKELRTRWAP